MIRIKRAYETPARGDGRRILVERLWPRGLTREVLAADEWAKDVAPSTPLRQWFGHQLERWGEFQLRYREELQDNPAAWTALLEASRHDTVTLLYAAHDKVHNSAVVLREFLAEHGADTHGSHGSPDIPGRRAGPARPGAH